MNSVWSVWEIGAITCSRSEEWSAPPPPLPRIFFSTLATPAARAPAGRRGDEEDVRRGDHQHLQETRRSSPPLSARSSSRIILLLPGTPHSASLRKEAAPLQEEATHTSHLQVEQPPARHWCARGRATWGTMPTADLLMVVAQHDSLLHVSRRVTLSGRDSLWAGAPAGRDLGPGSTSMSVRFACSKTNRTGGGASKSFQGPPNDERSVPDAPLVRPQPARRASTRLSAAHSPPPQPDVIPLVIV